MTADAILLNATSHELGPTLWKVAFLILRQLSQTLANISPPPAGDVLKVLLNLRLSATSVTESIDVTFEIGRRLPSFDTKTLEIMTEWQQLNLKLISDRTTFKQIH
ncbi:MAG: hypothetical protein ACTS4X_00905 [Candidatus Hodgkinia cicadicola]